MPLDDLVDTWTTFGRCASTADASMATSKAFAAIAEERAALRAYTLTTLETPTRTHLVGWHQASIESLAQAAIHWFAAACALEEYADQLIADDEITHEEAQLCTTRGARGVCPACVPLFPEQARTVRLVSCARHCQSTAPTRSEGAA